jgi:hypothetical protein
MAAKSLHFRNPFPRSRADTMRHLPSLSGLLFAVGCGLLFGCSRTEPSLFHVSGTVTFDGKPVVAGRVDFFPDVVQGNDGPQGFALIKDGRFDTRQGGQGHAGGPMVIRIEGFDGQSDNPRHFGSPIFKPYEIQRDLPKEPGEQTFEVPASAAQDFVAPPRSKS